MNNIELPDNIVNDIIFNYINSMKDSLLRGKKFYIKDIGYLEPKYRKVKNNKGRDFAITIRLKQDSEFSNLIIDSYNKDNNKFK